MNTEDSNPRSVDIDTLPTREILQRINAEDATVAPAVARELPAIEAVVDRVVDAFRAGGRLIYVGAGTSGRLGVLDAAECPPTYNTDPRQVQALLAGAPAALTRSVEGAEDDEAQGACEVDALAVDRCDVVLGIAASGRTPYVVGALRRARERGATTAALVANPAGPVAATAERVIAPQTGPEVVAGSTRMNAGTARHMALNMRSTAAKIRSRHVACAGEDHGQDTNCGGRTAGAHSGGRIDTQAHATLAGAGPVARADATGLHLGLTGPVRNL